MNDFILRKAEARDAARIAALLVDIARLHHAGRPDVFSDAGPKHDEADVRRMILSGEERIAVAADGDGRVLGYAIAVIRDVPADGLIMPRRIYYIDDLCVDAKARRGGIGRALLAYCRREAAELGCTGVELNVWACNRDAVAFYEKCGMTVQRQIMEIAPDAG